MVVAVLICCSYSKKAVVKRHFANKGWLLRQLLIYSLSRSKSIVQVRNTQMSITNDHDPFH